MPTIDIMRTTAGNGRHRMTIIIRDGRKVVFKGALTMENFAHAIAGINEVPFMTDAEIATDPADED